MIKRIVFAGLGLFMLASPLAVSAQTTDASNAGLIAILTQLIGVLEQELQQLIAQHQSAPTQPTTTGSGLAVTPTSGAAPLSVFFSEPAQAAQDRIDFGDGPPLEILGHDCASPGNLCSGTHIYTSAGTYTAMLKDSSGNVLSTTMITVTAAASDSASTTTSGLAVTPTSGPAPLTVTFSGGGSGGGNPNDGPFISFGDSSARVQMGCSAVASGGGCAFPYSITYTYTLTGAYRAQIYSEATGGVISSATVTVTE
jgi:hypothetical protein